MLRQITFIAAAAVTAGLALEAQITFEPPVQMPTGADPEWVAVGDWNGDGAADLAVTVRMPDRVLLYETNGLGKFGPAIEISLPLSHPKALIAGDVDRDGDLDLTVALYEMDLVLTLVNDGRGSFEPGFSCPVDPRPVMLAGADLDRDLDLDFVSLGEHASALNVMINDGQGGFTMEHLYVGATVLGIALGEFDVRTVSHVDHKALVPDLAVALEGSIDIYRNSGNAAFTRVQRLRLDPALDARPILAVDLDGIRGDDLVVGESGHLSLYRQVGRFEPSFAFEGRIPMARQPAMIYAADLDRDTDLDLVATNASPSAIAVIESHGGFVYGEAAYLLVGRDPACLSIADVDSTRSLDLLVADHGSSEISVLFNTRGRIHATAVARNGLALNRNCFSADGTPQLGTTWMGEVATSHHPGAMITYVLGYDAPLPSGVLTNAGEVLIDVFNGHKIFCVGVISAGFVHPFRMDVPADPALIGFKAYTQALILGNGAELCNAIDVVLGF